MVKPTFAKDVGGTLYFDVPEIGEIEDTTPAPAVTIYDHGGAEVDSGAATIASPGTESTPGRLSFVLTPTVCDEIGPQYRAYWEYTIGSDAWSTSQVFGVVKSVVKQPANAAYLTERYPIARNPTATTKAQYLTHAWGEVHARLRQQEIDPDRIVDATALKDAQAAFAAAAIARNLSAGNAASSEWQARAEALEEEGRRHFDAALADLWWYDASEDLLPGDRSTELGDVRIGR